MSVYIIKDENNLPKFIKLYTQLSQLSVEVGVLTSNKKILLKANANEYGVNIKVTEKMRKYLAAIGLPLKSTTSHIKIPERSYIRATFDKDLKKIENFAYKKLQEAFDLRLTATQYYQQLGAYCVSLVQKYMTTLRQPRNHPFTVQRKRSSNPLIDSGELRKSIEYRVVN